MPNNDIVWDDEVPQVSAADEIIWDEPISQTLSKQDEWNGIKDNIGQFITKHIDSSKSVPLSSADYGELKKEDTQTTIPTISVPDAVMQAQQEPKWKALGEETLPTAPLYETKDGLQVATAPERPEIEAFTKLKRGMLAQTKDVPTKVNNAKRVFEQGGYKILGVKPIEDGFSTTRMMYKLEKDGNEFLLDETSFESAINEIMGDPASSAIALGTLGIGKAIGLGAIGNAIDQAISKAVTGEELTPKQRGVEVAKEAVLFGAGETIVKGISKLPALANVLQRLKTLLKDGDIQGAKRVVKEDYGLTDENIDTMFESVKKDIKGFEDLTGDDLLRAKLTAVIQQQPQGKALITSAISKNAKAAIETSKEIDFRAKQLIVSANKFSKKPSAIKKSLEAYEKVVSKNYSQVKNLIDEALPNYKADLDIQSFGETLININKRVIDPDIRLKVENLAEVLASQPNKTAGDLIETRQLFNKFYGKNLRHFENAKDKEALFTIQKTIDGEIETAIKSIDDGGIISSQLSAAFKDAKAKYAKMFKAQDTATYNAIFKKGASEEDIGKALIKYSKATDSDLETVLGKLSPIQRTKSEFSILKHMVDGATAKGEAKAIDFVALLEDIGTSKAIFKTPEAKQFLKNIETYDRKFAKDIDIQRIASGVAPKQEKNIATSLVGKIMMKISSLRFEALQRMLPTETGRRLSLQKAVESALEKSRTPREFFFKASKIKGMPNKERIALKKAVKEIGEKEEQLKSQLVKQEEANKKAVLEAQTKKQEAETKKILSEQEFKKAKWEKAKEAAKKQTEQSRKAKEAAEPKIGGSEAEAKQEVKEVFAKSQEPTAKYKGMSKEDIAELERQEAETLFAKGAPELTGGAVAGIETDEQGNVTLDPEKFVMGVLGVSSIKGLAKAYKSSPKTQFKVNKALRSLAKDSTKVAGEMIEKINKQIGLNIEPKIIAGVKAEKAKLNSARPKGEEVFHPITKKTYILSNDGKVYWHRKNNDTWKESINLNQKKEIKELSEVGEKAFLKAREEVEKVEKLKTLPIEYDDFSESQKDFFKRALPKKEELLKETQRFISKKRPQPKKIYRGEVLEGEERIGGGAKEGYGVYTTVDKKLASQYGHILEMNPSSDLPKKPLVFTGMNEFEIWEQTLDYKVLKYRRASEKGDIALNEVVNIIDPSIDGIQIGSGIGARSGSYWVKFPSIEEFRNFGKPNKNAISNKKAVGGNALSQHNNKEQ